MGEAELFKGFDPAAFVRLTADHGHNALLGIGYAAHGADWVELRLPFRPDLAGDEATGVLATGPIFTLIDMVTSMAVWTRRGRFVAQATLDMRVDHLRAAAAGEGVTARGECYRLTRNVAFVRAEAWGHDRAQPVAQAAGTYMMTGE